MRLGIEPFVIEDVRKVIFPLVLFDFVPTGDKPIPLDSTDYLGVGFFVTKNGIALTAAHVLPAPDVVAGKQVYAIIWNGKVPMAHKVLSFVTPGDGTDIAVFRIEGIQTPYLELEFRHVHMGEDVSATGIPNDSTWSDEREYRLFKGHVMRAKRHYELNFPALKGMSGSPVICGRKVVAVISDNHRSQMLEDQHSEEEEIYPGMRRRKEVQTLQIVNFARAEPLLRIARMTHELIGEGALEDLVKMVNARP